MSPSIIDEATRQFKRSLERQFNPRKKREFSLRLSNIGRPACQLWYEKNGAEGEPRPYNHPVKMMFGDTIEIIAMAVLKAAGVDIEAINEAGEIVIEGQTVKGTSDVTIGGKIWDIKGVSKFSFENTYSSPYGYKELAEHDDFGYLAQAVGYSVALEKPFGGWIAVNKETGEFAVLEMPEHDIDAGRIGIVQGMEYTVRALESDQKPPRAFEDVPETYRKKPTGNRVLARACNYCDFKQVCWPGVQYLPAQASTSSDPAYKYYTHVEAKNGT